ncbi:PaaI family thioesterase [Patulibacter americanus]|uniref:PaaI family thioesterase n=1 Tax=Patulibacter americanus TaxID=588672 RepID=UPI0003B5D417|nr:PaaI family thioesterase [Patulibacter americanus]
MATAPELPPAAPLPVQGVPGDGPLRPHQPNCFGCGPENASGLGIRYAREGDVVRATLTLDERHEGARGLAHGGIVAAILDDIQGGVLVAMHQRAVTAKLDVDYVAPVVLGHELVAEAWLESHEGRKIRLVGRVLDDGRTVASCRSLFITVEKAHFLRYHGTPGEEPQVGT